MSSIKRMVITAMLISAGIVLPMIFHIIPTGLAGRTLLPMHIPVLVAGLIVGPFYGFSFLRLEKKRSVIYKPSETKAQRRKSESNFCEKLLCYDVLCDMMT